MPYDPITLLSTLSTIVLPPDTQDSLSVSWLDSYRMGFPPMKHYTLCWAHANRLPSWYSQRNTTIIRQDIQSDFSLCENFKRTLSSVPSRQKVWKEHLWQQLCALAALSVHAPCSLSACVHRYLHRTFHRTFVSGKTWGASMNLRLNNFHSEYPSKSCVSAYPARFSFPPFCVVAVCRIFV